MHETESRSVKQRRRTILGSLFILLFLIVSILGYINYPFASEQLFVVKEATKITEPGQKLSFHLNDGSRVILNAGSKLIYPETFNEQERIVHLEGEAFFEVSKDSLRPFRVITGSVVTTALGTSFNINSFSINKEIEVALVTGKVMVTEDKNSTEAVFLMPGEMATYHKGDDSLSKSIYNFKEEISWKDGVLYFKDAGYSEIVRKLELWYGVDIVENRIPEKTWNFTGTFEDENLVNILNSLQFGHGFKYEIIGKKVELKF
jgi:ferric-dicitrate binding protein FerR (iron transport regulator)